MKLSKVSISSLVFVPPARVLSNQTNSYVKDPFKTAYPFVLEREILHNFASNVRGEGWVEATLQGCEVPCTGIIIDPKRWYARNVSITRFHP